MLFNLETDDLDKLVFVIYYTGSKNEYKVKIMDAIGESVMFYIPYSTCNFDDKKQYEDDLKYVNRKYIYGIEFGKFKNKHIHKLENYCTEKINKYLENKKDTVKIEVKNTQHLRTFMMASERSEFITYLPKKYTRPGSSSIIRAKGRQYLPLDFKYTCQVYFEANFSFNTFTVAPELKKIYELKHAEFLNKYSKPFSIIKKETDDVDVDINKKTKKEETITIEL